MALDLSTKQLPWTDTVGLTTSLVAVVPPNGARQIKLKPSVASYLQVGTGADTDAVTSDKVYPLAANAEHIVVLSVGDDPQRPQPTVLVAAQSGTGTLYVLAEGAE